MNLIHLSELSSKELSTYVRQFYHNPHEFLDEEFKKDFKLFLYTKRLIKRHMNNYKINLRIILNNIIILSNLFGAKPASIILLFSCGEDMWSPLKSFLSYLNIIPQDLAFVNIKSDPVIDIFLGEL